MQNAHGMRGWSWTDEFRSVRGAHGGNRPRSVVSEHLVECQLVVSINVHLVELPCVSVSVLCNYRHIQLRTANRLRIHRPKPAGERKPWDLATLWGRLRVDAIFGFAFRPLMNSAWVILPSWLMSRVLKISRSSETETLPFGIPGVPATGGRRRGKAPSDGVSGMRGRGGGGASITVHAPPSIGPCSKTVHALPCIGRFGGESMMICGVAIAYVQTRYFHEPSLVVCVQPGRGGLCFGNHEAATKPIDVSCLSSSR